MLIPLPDWFDCLDSKNRPLLNDREILSNLQAIVKDADKTPVQQVGCSVLASRSASCVLRPAFCVLLTRLVTGRPERSRDLDHRVSEDMVRTAKPAHHLQQIECKVACGGRVGIVRSMSGRLRARGPGRDVRQLPLRRI